MLAFCAGGLAGLLLTSVVTRESMAPPAHVSVAASTPHIQRNSGHSIARYRHSSSGVGRRSDSGDFVASPAGHLQPRPSHGRTQRNGREARTHGPFYGDLEGDGEFERSVRMVSRHGELVLLHGDSHRLRMVVNLVANLNEHRIYHILMLGFNEETCVRLAVRRRIGCAHSSYLWDLDAQGGVGELAAARARWLLESKYVAWIQKWHYMRMYMERRVNVLALDSDVVATANPYPHLNGAFGRFALVTAFDTKGGFANVNIGIVYVQNASIGGPVHGLFLEFERRIALALRMPPPHSKRKREWLGPHLFWDQNLFNKVLLSNLARRAVFMPDESDREWTRSHREWLRLVGRPEDVVSAGPHASGTRVWQTVRGGARPPSGWMLPDEQVDTPSAHHVRSPWYPRRADYRWRELSPPATASSTVMVPGEGGGGERVLLAPSWLISADNSLGHRYKHWLYGARPAPCVLLHFVCVATGEGSRILPMKLFGRWHADAVHAEMSAHKQYNASAHARAAASSQHASSELVDKSAQQWGLAISEPRAPLLGLVDATLESPMAPRPWPQLNALQALLGALAMLSERTLALPAIDCKSVADDFLRPGMLPNRCFWHVHTARGVSCVFRAGKCADNVELASPTDLHEAIERARSRGTMVPIVALDLSQGLDSASPALGEQLAALQRLASHEVVLVRLSVPRPERTGGHTAMDEMNAALRSQAAGAAGGQLRAAMHRFQARCPELMDRSKRHKRECTNVC